jgi:TolA-binding protein
MGTQYGQPHAKMAPVMRPRLGWGLIPMSIANYALGLTFTASPSLIPIARFRCRRSEPKDTANLAQTLDQLLKKNQQLLERNRHLMGEVVSLRNNPLNSIPVNQVQTLDHLTDKNQQLQEQNQKIVGEVAAVRSKLVGRGEARTKVRKTTAKIAAWIVSAFRRH